MVYRPIPTLADFRNEGDLSARYYDPELRRHSTHDKHSPNPSSKSTGIYPQSSKVVGPTLPTAQDIQLQREQRAEDAEKDQEYRRLERKHERRLEKERLEELVPRAEAGTRERQLEKRKEVTAAHRAFRDKSPDMMQLQKSHQCMRRFTYMKRKKERTWLTRRNIKNLSAR